MSKIPFILVIFEIMKNMVEASLSTMMVELSLGISNRMFHLVDNLSLKMVMFLREIGKVSMEE
jgi:hypothetical protein